VFLVAGQVNKEVSRQLRALYPSLRALALAGSTNHELFPRLMERMPTIHMPDQVQIPLLAPIPLFQIKISVRSLAQKKKIEKSLFYNIAIMICKKYM
jgi:hypothetical protein